MGRQQTLRVANANFQPELPISAFSVFTKTKKAVIKTAFIML
jgi:hypothetical protein